MDALAGLLDGPRARRAFLLRSVLEAPWALRVEDEAPLTVVAVLRGCAWIVPDSTPPSCLKTGDIAVMRGDEPYTMADAPTTAPQTLIGPGQVCTDLAGAPMVEQMSLGVRTWGNADHADGGTATLLTGTYASVGEVGRRLLAALPTVVRLSSRSPVVDLLAAEIGRDGPGQAAVLDRLLDLLLITTLREWFTDNDTAAPRWWTAHADPVVGPALRLIEHNPAQPWTVADLAAQVGISRAALARRFSETLGESPIAYLTGHRLALAADRLADSDVTVSQLARECGYGSPFAFSTAFKRRYGRSPHHYRLRAG